MGYFPIALANLLEIGPRFLFIYWARSTLHRAIKDNYLSRSTIREFISYATGSKLQLIIRPTWKERHKINFEGNRRLTFDSIYRLKNTFPNLLILEPRLLNFCKREKKTINLNYFRYDRHSFWKIKNAF